MAMHENDQGQTGKPEKTKTAGRNILRIIISLVLILAGIGGARFLIATKPKVNKRPPVKMEPLVRATSLQPQKYTVHVPAMGTVIPAREISLESQVAGEVIYLHPEFTEGGMLPKGSKILEINRKDYELALQQKKRAVSDAEYALKLELGQQDVARKEWDLLYGDQETDEVESELALRKPHLEKVQMEIAAAEAALEQANIDLERTTLTAPFNVLVLRRYINLGSQITSQEKIADLVGTDAYWVQVSLPVEKLKWVQIPNGQDDSGSSARIKYRQDYIVEGRVVRLLPDLSKEGRMARLLLEVNDPLGLQEEDKKRPMLLIGEYVRVFIEGEELDDVYQIPRSALRNNNEVWLVDDESRLLIKNVEPIWRDEESVLVRDGFRPGERFVVSGLAAPVAGMTVRVESPETKDTKQQKSTAK